MNQTSLNTAARKPTWDFSPQKHQTMNDIPERLRAFAETLIGDDWIHPLGSVDTCLEAAKAIEAMERREEAAQCS